MLKLVKYIYRRRRKCFISEEEGITSNIKYTVPLLAKVIIQINVITYIYHSCMTV